MSKMEGRWIQSLREHGDAYSWCVRDLETLRLSYHDQLARTNPEKPYLVAKLQGKIEALDDLLLFVTNQERKDAEHAKREQRNTGPVRVVRSA